MKDFGKTQSERLVSSLCESSFLSLWNYPNPRGKDPGKEMCDNLIVCDPDVIVFSVKESEVKNKGDLSVAMERWRRYAVDGSKDQIHGAQRRINLTTHVVTADGQIGHRYPDAANRRTHRVAVAFGGNRSIPFSSGDEGKGFVHVIDEISVVTLLSELDTITDFVKYLIDREALFRATATPNTILREEDLLAAYLFKSRTFPNGWMLMR